MTPEPIQIPTHARPSAGRHPCVVPYDWRATARLADWRRDLAWPTPPQLLRGVFDAMQRAYVARLERLTGDHQRAALLASGVILGCARPLVDAAICLERAPAAGIELVAETPELGYLAGELAEPPPTLDPFRFNPLARPRLTLARRIARTASWTPPWRLIPALVAPRAVAMTHNDLLREVAVARGLRLGFRHAEGVLAEARRGGAPAAVDTTELAELFADDLLPAEVHSAAPRARLRGLLRRQCAELLERAARDIAGLARTRRLPDDLWTGTGSYYPSRAVGIEALRRGASVTRFDHGGACGLVRDDYGLALRELAVSSRLVVAPPPLAEVVRRSPARSIAAAFRETEIEAHRRDSQRTAIAPPAGRPGRSGRGRPMVLYATTVLRGFFQTVFGIIPDVVYLDWQLRLAEMVREAPVDLLCKPHPAGLLAGQRHPLEEVASVSYEPFEKVMDGADAFLFDRCQSTTFWTALCTDRPVVLIDLGITEFAADAAPALGRRIRTVKASFDARNRPWVDRDALHEALLGGPQRVDPTEVLALLAGEA